MEILTKVDIINKNIIIIIIVASSIIVKKNSKAKYFPYVITNKKIH